MTDDMDMPPGELEQVVEALVFASDEAVSAARVADIYAEVTGSARPDEADVDRSVISLNERLAAAGRAVRLERWGGGYRMATTHEMAPFVKALFQREQQRRLSRSLLETVAILAYRQPATKPEIDFVRGVESDYALRRLLELGLVDVVGRAESPGRPLLYGTTARFLDLFGLDGLQDLPNLREIEAILDDPSFHRERARLLVKSGAAGLPATEGHGSAVGEPADDRRPTDHEGATEPAPHRSGSETE